MSNAKQVESNVAGGGGGPAKGKKNKDLLEEVRTLTSLYIEPQFIAEGSQTLLCEYYKDFIQTLLLKVRQRHQLKKNPSPDEYKNQILAIIQNDDKILYKAIKTQFHDLRYRIYEDANKKKDEDVKLDDGDKKNDKEAADQNDDDYNNEEYESI